MCTVRGKLHYLPPLQCFRLYFYPHDVRTSRTVNRSFCVSKGLRVRRLACLSRTSSDLNQKCCIHTIKGWRYVTNPKLNELETDESNVVCEDSTDAVPHTELLARLNSCKNVREQIYTLSSSVSLSPEDIENRRQFCESLSQAIKLYLPESKLYQYGSGMNTLGFKGSDVDVCIKTDNNEEKPPEYTKMWNPPELEEVLNGSVDPSLVANLHPKIALRFIRRVIRRHCTDVRNPIFLIKARVPLLKLYNEKYNLFCDFSFDNGPAICNTRLLRFICHLDSRIRPLIQVLRYWGKVGKFVGDIDMLNSYAFSLLVVYFLQNTNPPIIPPINVLLEKAEYLDGGDVDDDNLLFSSLKSIPCSKNTQEVDDLLREFFFFYGFCEFKRVMLILNSSSMPLQDFRSGLGQAMDEFEVGCICLQDPYRHTKNATCGLLSKSGLRFLCSLVEGCLLFQNDRALLRNSSQNWGVAQLLESAASLVSEQRYTPNITHDSITVQLPEQLSSTSEGMQQQLDISCRAAHLFKEILDYSYLMNCKPMIIKPQNYETAPVLRFMCEVSHNVWVGRHRVLKEHFTDSATVKPLELERLVSLHLTQQQVNKNPVVFRFYCDCYSLMKNGQPHLKVDVKFDSGKLSSILSIFLKEYVPKIMKNVL